jgi:cyanophycinase-like exopeptidase
MKNIEVDKAIYIVGGDQNKYWSLMQEAMIIG